MIVPYVDCCVSFVVCRVYVAFLLFAFVVRYSLFVVRCLWFVVGCLLLCVRCLLIVCVLFVVFACCLLFLFVDV